MAILGLDRFFQPKRSRRIVDIPPVAQPDETAKFLCVGAIVKDEEKILEEWLEFHLLVGVEHFFIYDNGSADGTIDILRRYCAKGLVTLVAWPHFVEDFHTQVLAYAHCLATYGKTSRWIAFIDADEFLFSPGSTSLQAVLAEFQRLPALVVYRYHFGTSGHRHPPTGLVTRNFIERMPTPSGKVKLKGLTAPKSIVQPCKVRRILGAHTFALEGQENLIGFDEQGHAISDDGTAEIVAEKLRINHYYARDLETFRRRRMASGNSATNKNVSKFDKFEANLKLIDSNSVVDKTVEPLARALEELLARRAGESMAQVVSEAPN